MPASDGSDADLHARAWGRVPAARPPLAPWAPLAWWLITSAALIIVVVAVVRGPGPKDDPDPADQRPGFLTATDSARKVRDLTLPGAPLGHRPVLIVFDRRAPSPRRYARVLRRVSRRFAVMLVLPHPAQGSAPSRGSLVVDPKRRIARAVGVHRPVDHGPPVGYAVIDRHARVRYATLEPSYLSQGFELSTITGAVG